MKKKNQSEKDFQAFCEKIKSLSIKGGSSADDLGKAIQEAAKEHGLAHVATIEIHRQGCQCSNSEGSEEQSFAV